MKKKLISISSILFLMFSCIAFAYDYQPGSKDDPIVTKSFVENLVLKTQKNLEEKIEKSNQKPNEKTYSDLEIVSIKANQKIILSQGSKIILRSGKASVIDSKMGGLSDLTQGIDLKMGYDLPDNHLVLCPKNDNRGIFAKTDIILLIEGGYDIEK